ncbi:hypothetical protein PQX77_007855 [Marasmius sp. AFHP31]|nr:hypothetical protein PQX77_007855 [Marasmius sp. AFHP31]
MLPHLPLSQQHQPHHLQQQQQQQQQGQQNDHHHLGMPPFSEQRNPWFQQQQMLQMRNQSQNGPDMSNPSVSQQMAELMRNPNMNRMPNQQQNFGFTMGNHGLNPNQPPFLDQQNQTNPQNRMSPLGFPNNMGGPGGMQGQNTGNFNPAMNRNAMMFQALQRDQNNNRQLELMSLAQNQQNQNGPFNLANRLGAAGMPTHQGSPFPGGGAPGMNQPGGPSQGDLMPPGGADAMRRPSPHPHPPNQPTQQQPAGGVQPGPPFGNPQPPQMPGAMNNGGRLVLLSELQERQNAMRNALTQLEFSIRSLTAARSQMPDQVFAQKMRTFSADLAQKRDGLQRVTALINQMTSQGRTHMTLPVAQPPGGPAVSGGQPWMQPGMPNNSLQPPSFSPSGMPGGPNTQASQGQANGQPSPSPGHVSAVPAVRPGSIPPHNPNSSPFPHPNQSNPSSLPFNNIGAPNNSQAPQPGGVMPNNPAANPGTNALNPGSFPIPQHYPPLAKDRFLVTYKNFCAQKRLVHDQSLLSSENLNIDLHTLHSEVMKEGGWASVQQKDLWAVIAGRMGCVQFPGTPTEPPRSGPGAADRVAHVYRSYLAEFDRIYMNSVQNEFRRKILLQQLSSNQLKGMNPHQMRMMVQVSDVPADNLRGKMPDEMLRVLEANRQMLQLMKQDQNMFQTLRPPGQPSNPGGVSIGHDSGMPGQPPFNNPPQRIGGGIAGLPPNNPQGSTQGARLQAALQEIQLMKQEHLPKIGTLPTVEVSNDQRLEYNNLLEQVHRASQEVERKLPFFHVALSTKQPDPSGSTRRLVTHIINIQQQRQMIGFSTPRFFLSLQDLRSAQGVLHTALEYVATHWKAVAGGGAVMPGTGSGPGPGMQIPARPPTQPPVNPPGVIPRGSPPQVPPAHPSPPGNPIPRPLPNLQPPPPGPKRKGTTPLLSAASPPNGAAINTPTPPANPSTPAANALTPTQVSSPQTPKSPKGKAQPKPRAPKQRRPSTTVPKPNVTPTTTPLTESAQIPPPAGTNSLKRPREDDEVPPPSMNGAGGPPSTANNAIAGPSSQANGPANEPSPPKKFKQEWDGPPSEELIKKEEAVESIKTEEDATMFLEQMTQLIQMSNNEDGGNSLSQDISETLDMILKGYSAAPDGDHGTGLSSMLGGDLSGSGAGSSSPVKEEYELSELFDFSSYAAHEDDAGSKANTPDLISTTNPSPESGSETDPAHPASVLSETKLEEFSDPLRLGGLKEIDGGESAFFQSNEWKWDAPMTTLDQPWAIFNS